MKTVSENQFSGKTHFYTIAFQYQRLRLNFVPSHYGFSHCDSLQTIIVDDIVGMKVGQGIFSAC